jgi:hypothetical protein
MLKKSVVALSAALLAACFAGTAAADIVCPDSSYCEVVFGQTYGPTSQFAGLPYDYLTTDPANGGESFNSFGIDIRVYLKNCDGEPLIGVPAQEVVLFNSNLCICPGGGASDAGTDSNGCATWTGTLATGGCVDVLDVYADGVFICTLEDASSRTVKLNSTDQAHAPTSPCFTDSSDLASLAAQLGQSAIGRICFDFNELDPTIDLSDLAFFAASLGAACQ